MRRPDRTKFRYSDIKFRYSDKIHDGSFQLYDNCISSTHLHDVIFVEHCLPQG